MFGNARPLTGLSRLHQPPLFFASGLLLLYSSVWGLQSWSSEYLNAQKSARSKAHERRYTFVPGCLQIWYTQFARFTYFF